MSPDVRDLTGEKLPSGRFPASPRADFRLYIAPEVRRGIAQHAKADVTVEICGVLVGKWETDENGPYVHVTDYIRCENASSKFAEVTFTHESWAQINKEMDTRYADARIVGWYHSHPDFGIFLSDRDCFIQQHFFSAPGQVAYVIDPVRDLEGAFAWRDGKPTLLPHFWVGDRIVTAAASERNGASEPAAQAAALGAIAPAAAERSLLGIPSLNLATAALILFVLFWLGYLYGSWRSNWEQRMIIEGAVAHFADTKLIREGLETELAAVRSRLHVVTEDLQKLPEPAAELTKEQREEAAQREARIRENLAVCTAALTRVERIYGFSDEERFILARIAAQKQAELRRMLEGATPRAKDQKSAKSAPQAKQPTSQASKQPDQSAATGDSAGPTPTEQTGNPKQ